MDRRPVEVTHTASVEYRLGMTVERSNLRSSFSLWRLLALVTLLWLLYVICVPNFVRSGPGKTNGIVNNLRQLDAAKQQWALDHGRTGSLELTVEDVAPYLRPLHAGDAMVTPVAGERYRLRALTESPEAQLTREVDGRPKGTVIRLGTNSIEIILDPTNGWIR